MKKLVILFILCIFFTSCSEKRYSTEFFGYFDTVVTLDGFFESREDFEKASELVEDTLYHYHSLFDIHTNGQLKQLNEKGSLEISPDLLDAIKFGIDAEEKTNGYCNIAMGSVLSVWHEARQSETPYLPSRELLSERSEFTNIEDIEIKGNVVTLPNGMTLDLGAVAKGYVCDILSVKLKNEGFDNLILNMGGNVLVLGDKNSDGWKVGVQSPLDPSSLAETVKVNDSSLVTSGVYQRFFEYEGVRYHHIISPDTLFPSDTYLSVSVLYAESKWADALSTALFSMDLENAYHILENFPDIAVLWIKKDGSKIYYGNFRKIS